MYVTSSSRVRQPVLVHSAVFQPLWLKSVAIPCFTGVHCSTQYTPSSRIYCCERCDRTISIGCCVPCTQPHHRLSFPFDIALRVFVGSDTKPRSSSASFEHNCSHLCYAQPRSWTSKTMSFNTLLLVLVKIDDCLVYREKVI